MHEGEFALYQLLTCTGNCPKYLNKKRIVPATPQPRLILDSPQLSQGAIDLLNHADTLFLSTSHHQESMDTNIRGGCRGFVRILSNDSTGAVLVYPEYSGNRLYQSLGNLQTTPRAGYVFPDFETGNVLYATGTTEILAGKDAAALLPRSNLAVKVTLTAARYVEKGLPFRGEPGEDSPYNPPLRYLSVEKLAPVSQVPQDNAVSARLVGAEEITPTISRFRFRISDPAAVSTWIPGQYAILDFKDELDMGYRHMEDLDPAVLNDDFIRTFTVSSHPGRKLPKNEFEITARISGRVTKHLSRSGDRNYMEVLLRGFNGDFRLGNTGENDATVGLVIGGIGITPVIAQLHTVNASRLRLYWSINVKDIALVHDIFEQFSGLQKSTTLFLTGLEAAGDKLSEQEHMTLKSVLDSGAQIKKCRLKLGDLDLEGTGIWYLCAGAALRKDVLGWLDGKRVVYEDFGY